MYRVKVLINQYLWYILNEGLEFRVQCMICFVLMQKAILLISKTCILSLKNVGLCCYRIDTFRDQT